LELTDNKLKVFTKQIYNHMIDEYGNDFKFTPQNIYDKIWDRQDEILTLLTSKMTSDIRKGVSFMVSIYSKDKDLDSIIKTVKDNYTYMDVVHYDNYSHKDIECSSCGGNGREDCDRCDSRGSESCAPEHDRKCTRSAGEGCPWATTANHRSGFAQTRETAKGNRASRF
jgi:hypothetical protein